MRKTSRTALSVLGIITLSMPAFAFGSRVPSQPPTQEQPQQPSPEELQQRTQQSITANPYDAMSAGSRVGDQIDGGTQQNPD
jgi:hypothetical protein